MDLKIGDFVTLRCTTKIRRTGESCTLTYNNSCIRGVGSTETDGYFINLSDETTVFLCNITHIRKEEVPEAKDLKVVL